MYRVLIIDDEKFIRKVSGIASIGKNTAFSVAAEAGNGAEAIRL